VGALSLYHTSFPVGTELYEALDLDLTHGKRPDSYSKRSDVLQHYCQGLQAFRTPSRLDIQEAAGIFDVWMKDRALHTSRSSSVGTVLPMHMLTPAHLAYFSCLGPTFPIEVLRIGWECQRVCVAWINDYFRYLIGWLHVSVLIYYATTIACSSNGCVFQEFPDNQ
jgi:hypothetical protein